MWSKNPKPVAISDLPVPSKLSVSEIFVSFVLRETVAMRCTNVMPSFYYNDAQMQFVENAVEYDGHFDKGTGDCVAVRQYSRWFFGIVFKK